MQICVNGEFQPAEQPVFRVSNRGYRYGDGVFETMLYRNGRIPLADYHMNRLFEAVEVLGLELPNHFTWKNILELLSNLCTQNNCHELGRIRLSVHGGDGDLFHPRSSPGYVIEAWPLDPSFLSINEQGLEVGIFPDGRKGCDEFSNLKSASALIYVLAARFARENNWDDCLVLNNWGTIADSSIFNLFILSDTELITPPLSDGCVDGVMRRYLIDHTRPWLKSKRLTFSERSVEPAALRSADEIFLTNAIRGIRWVGSHNGKKYTNEISSEIFREFIQPLFT